MPEEKLQSLEDIFRAKLKAKKIKPPSYEWQDFALEVIAEIGAPGFKRASVFKICKDMPKEKVLHALNDTKELCQSGEKWKYFFKVIAGENKK